jgi:nickel-dependent lactate racemase
MEKELPNRQGFVFVGGKEMEFDVPPGWEIICQSAPRKTLASEDSIRDMVHRSLQNPIGSARIRELANPSSKVAILVDDDTRPTPVKDVLPLVLQELHDCNVPKENIDIIVAVGTHPPLVGKRLKKRLGEQILKDYRVTNHDSWAHDLVSIGRVRDIEVRINPIVAQADLKIGIGANLPHPLAGFGGGAKIAMPGICGYDTIREHHTSTLLEPGSYLGRIKRNPFYDFICQVSEMLGLSYVIDCVVDSQGRAVEIVSGHSVKAHEAGVAVCREIYGVEIREKADVTISSRPP